jgi:hypothetical protein
MTFAVPLMTVWSTDYRAVKGDAALGCMTVWMPEG